MKTSPKTKASPTVEPQATPDMDARELMVTMAKALCRQHIMWPTEGALPCETGVDCDKQPICSQMAKDVINFTKQLEANKES
ncbi:MAG: hypothetical protein HQ504_06905 [Rhodospirillaceae bacterium]|nr:hypothetical protein [Rhodospirillaceae bacterium]